MAQAAYATSGSPANFASTTNMRMSVWDSNSKAFTRVPDTDAHTGYGFKLGALQLNEIYSPDGEGLIIALDDNLADAFSVSQGATDYLKAVTTDGSESMTLGVALEFGSNALNGTGTITTTGVVDLGATTVDSLNASSGGITNAGAISGATTLTASGLLTGGSLVLASGATVTGFADEDNMASNSATLLATQQSIKAYVDAQVGGIDTLAELTDTTISGPSSGQIVVYDGTDSWDNRSLSGDATLASTGAITLTATNTNLTTLANVTTVGALNAGSITSGFGAINIGGDDLTAGAATFTGDMDLDAAGGTLSVNASYAGASFDMTATEAASGTHARIATVEIGAPAITGGLAALTAAASLYIAAAPTGGTENYALWVDAGAAQFDGAVSADGLVTGLAGLTVSGGAISLTATGAMSATGTTSGSFGDDVGTWEFDGAGAVTETGMTSLSVTPSGAITLTAGAASSWTSTSGALTIDSAAAATWGTAAGALTLDGTGGVNIAGNSSEIDLTTSGAVDINSGAGTWNASTLALTSTGLATWSMMDNNADALVIQEASNVYLTFDTTDSDETIIAGKSMTFEAGATVKDDQSLTFGTNDDWSLLYDEATDDAFEIRNSASSRNFLQVTTTAMSYGNATDAPDHTFHGSMSISGTLTVDGGTFQTAAEKVMVSDNHMYLNSGYTTASAETAGLVVNYLPTSTADDTVGAGVFTAGVSASSDPTVTTQGTATFSAGDIIQISGSDGNDGLYEVQGHSGTTLTIKSTATGVTDQAYKWVTDNQFTAGTDTGAGITKVTISVMRCGTDGLWEYASGATTGALTFDNFGSLAQSQTYTGAKTYTGGVTVNTGALDVNNGSTFAGGSTFDGGTVQISAGTLDCDVSSDFSAAMVISAGSFTSSAVTSNLNGAIFDGTPSFSGATSMAAGLTLDTAGTLDCDVASDFSAVVTISAGSFISSAVTSTLNGAIFDGTPSFSGATSMAAGLTLDTAGSLDCDVSADFSANVTNSAGEFLVSGGNVQLNDSIAMTFGTSDDLTISHDGTNSTISNTTGSLEIYGAKGEESYIGTTVTNKDATTLAVGTVVYAKSGTDQGVDTAQANSTAGLARPFGVSVGGTIAADANGQVACEGLVQALKDATTSTWANGVRLYLQGDGSVKDVSTGMTYEVLVGYAAEAATNGPATCLIRLASEPLLVL